MMRRSTLDAVQFLMYPTTKVVDMTPSSSAPSGSPPPLTSTTNSFLNSSASNSFFNLLSGSASNIGSVAPSTTRSTRPTKRPQNLDQKYKQAEDMLGLQVDDILYLLREVIPAHCGRPTRTKRGGASKLPQHKIYTAEERDLLESCQHHTAEILHNIVTDGEYPTKEWPRSSLDDVASILQTFLDQASQQELSKSRRKQVQQKQLLEPALLVKIHTTLGLLRRETCGPKAAIESLQKALWIQNKHAARVSAAQALEMSLEASSPDLSRTSAATSLVVIPPEEIGMTCHRLSLAYAANHQTGHARSLLQAALDHYEKESSALCHKPHHPLVLTARDGMEVTYSNAIELTDRSEDDGDDIVPGLKRSPMSSYSPSSTRSLSGPYRRRLLKSSAKDWSSLPAMPALQSSREE